MRFVLFVFTLGMLCAFAPMCTDMYLPALPSVMLDYGCSASLVQISLSASFLGLSIGQIFIGPLSDVYGRKLPLFVSLVLFALYLQTFIHLSAPDFCRGWLHQAVSC